MGSFKVNLRVVGLYCDFRGIAMTSENPTIRDIFDEVTRVSYGSVPKTEFMYFDAPLGVRPGRIMVGFMYKYAMSSFNGRQVTFQPPNSKQAFDSELRKQKAEIPVSGSQYSGKVIWQYYRFATGTINGKKTILQLRSEKQPLFSETGFFDNIAILGNRSGSDAVEAYKEYINTIGFTTQSIDVVVRRVLVPSDPESAHTQAIVRGLSKMDEGFERATALFEGGDLEESDFLTQVSSLR